MDSLFSGNYVNTQPLRKFEPLIRYDSDGNPQPKKPLDPSADFNDQNLTKRPLTSTSPEEAPKTESKPQETITNNRQDKPHEELKRKCTEPLPGGSEPKKKQQKQQSITSFFKKC